MKKLIFDHFDLDLFWIISDLVDEIGMDAIYILAENFEKCYFQDGSYIKFWIESDDILHIICYHLDDSKPSGQEIRQ